MPAPTNTLLIEGSFSELAEEFAQYIDTLRKEGNLQSEIAPLIQPIREQEQSEGEPDLKQRDEVLKKLVGAAAVLNGAPEKGEWEIVDIAADKEKRTSRRILSDAGTFAGAETDSMDDRDHPLLQLACAPRSPVLRRGRLPPSHLHLSR